MKTLRLILLSVFMLSIPLFYSCEKSKDFRVPTGTAEFSIALPAEGVAKSFNAVDSTVLPVKLLLSITDPLGKAVFTDTVISVYSFGTGFVSQNIRIPAGEYKLTKFMLINSTGAVGYASPIAGSSLSYLCTRPLPFSFNIVTDQVTKIAPEVLAVANQTPDKFGYAAFGIRIVNPLEFYAAAVLDNPLLMAPAVMTSASLTIYGADNWKFTFKLEPAINRIVIRGGSDVYKFVLTKDGYPSLTMQFTSRQLLERKKESPLILKIPAGTTTEKIITIQPGPDKGKDAMITNLEPDKNFGSHKYFETTFLSEPMLTVMRSTRSLIFFNLDTVPKGAKITKVVMKLSYDVPIPFDKNLFTPEVLPTAGTAWYGGVLRQITGTWDEKTVTWNNQPATIEANQVFIPPFIRNTNIYEVDVTKLFVNSSTTPVANNGIMFKLWPSDKFPGFRFASSDFPTATMRPALIIRYVL
jgi:hypothetical protein